MGTWNKNYTNHVVQSYINGLSSTGLYFIRSQPSFLLLDVESQHRIYFAAVEKAGSEIQYIRNPTPDLIEAAIKQWPGLKTSLCVNISMLSAPLEQ
jgi:hypothetical protein